MSPTDLHVSLLRPPVLQILRAAGFQSARSAAFDALVDLAARYLLLLATRTAAHAWSNHGSPEPDVIDVRMTLEAVGALRPAHGALEDQFADGDDLRGVRAFVDWARGDANREIMRIAGMAGGENDAAGLEGGREDFLTILRKKHSKTGEEARFQGTVLGKNVDQKPVKIDGDEAKVASSIRGWEGRLQQAKSATLASTPLSRDLSPPPSGMSSPLSEL